MKHAAKGIVLAFKKPSFTIQYAVFRDAKECLLQYHYRSSI